MKISNAEWLGNIPKEWGLRRIDEIYKERNQKVSDSEYQPLSVTMKGIVSQLSTAAKTDAHDDRKLVCKGDFVINSRSDRRGSCGISSCDGSVSLINTVLQPQENMNSEYYNWLFHTSMFADEFYKWGHGIVDDLWTTKWQDMKQILVPEPTLKEQREVANFLEFTCKKIDSVINKTRCSIEEYKKLSQSTIAEAVTTGIQDGRPLKKKGMEWAPKIPDGIAVTKVGKLFEITLGKMLCSAPPDEEYTCEPFYCAADVHFGSISTNTERKRMWFNSAEKSQFLVKKGDLLVVEGGAGAGGCAIVDFITEPTYIQNSIMIVRSKGSLSTRYLRYWIEYLVNLGYIDVVCNKATIPHFTKEKLANTPILLFTTKESEKIADYLDSRCLTINAIISKKEQFLAELESYKKSIIYEYVTGKKEVSA